MPAWRLYYDDKSTFDDNDGSWMDAPHVGVLVLATPDVDVGRELDHGQRGEFFAWWPGTSKPWGYDRTGILDYLSAVGWPTTTRLADLSLDDWRQAGVKIGRSVDNAVWSETLARVVADPDFAPKSATATREY